MKTDFFCPQETPAPPPQHRRHRVPRSRPHPQRPRPPDCAHGPPPGSANSSGWSCAACGQQSRASEPNRAPAAAVPALSHGHRRRLLSSHGSSSPEAGSLTSRVRAGWLSGAAPASTVPAAHRPCPRAASRAGGAVGHVRCFRGSRSFLVGGLPRHGGCSVTSLASTHHGAGSYGNQQCLQTWPNTTRRLSLPPPVGAAGLEHPEQPESEATLLGNQVFAGYVQAEQRDLRSFPSYPRPPEPAERRQSSLER